MKQRKNNIIILLAVCALTLAAAVFVYPPAMKTLGIKDFRPYRFGLDIAGGSQLVYEVDMSKVAETDKDSVMNGLRDVIERRVNLFGVSEPRVVAVASGANRRILVELAGVRDVQEAIRQIGSTPLLDFREVREGINFASTSAPAGSDGATAEADTTTEYIRTDLTGRYIKSAQVGFDQTTREPLVLLNFNEEGGKLFETITGKNIGKPLAIFLDGERISAPVVNQKIIGGSAQISGGFTLLEVQELVERFNAGALPAPIELVSRQTVDAVLGQRALELGILAGMAGTLAVMLFMIIYYGVLGVFATIALVIYITLTLAVFKMIPVTLSLAGIAGFILSIGMAVDANVLIFERTREEMKKGMSRGGAITEGFNRAWPSIRDSNASTIITALVLYFFTTSIVKGFALTLFLGVVLSMFSAVSVTRTLLRVFSKAPVVASPQRQGKK